MREKLIKLIHNARYEVEGSCNERLDCEDCPAAIHKGRCKAGYIADHLIANGVTIQQWISVKDRLPENEKCVLVYSQDGGVAEGKYNARFNEWVQFRWNVTELKNVTHWMPLPPAPKGE